MGRDERRAPRPQGRARPEGDPERDRPRGLHRRGLLRTGQAGDGPDPRGRHGPPRAEARGRAGPGDGAPVARRGRRRVRLQDDPGRPEQHRLGDGRPGDPGQPRRGRDRRPDHPVRVRHVLEPRRGGQGERLEDAPALPPEVGAAAGPGRHDAVVDDRADRQVELGAVERLEFDGLHRQALSEMDPKKRDQLYKQMQDRMEASGAFVWLTNGDPGAHVPQLDRAGHDARRPAAPRLGVPARRLARRRGRGTGFPSVCTSFYATDDLWWAPDALLLPGRTGTMPRTRCSHHPGRPCRGGGRRRAPGARGRGTSCTCRAAAGTALQNRATPRSYSTRGSTRSPGGSSRRHGPRAEGPSRADAYVDGGMGRYI